MKRICWGIIGLGKIAGKFAEAVTNMENTKLVAVASRSKEKAENFGKKYGILKEKCYGSYEEMLIDKEIDIVYIAVPHTLHKETAVMCLKNGKSVLCEKPVTINSDEIKEVISLAKEKKLFFMEAMKTRFLPVNQRIKEIIKSGKIGTLKLLQADFAGNVPYNPDNRLFNREFGGGSLLDLGIYCLSFSSYIFEDNSPVFISSHSKIGKNSGVDESNSVILSYKNGYEAQLYSALDVSTKREAVITGTKGRIHIERFSNAEYASIITDIGMEKIEIPHRINGFEYQIEECIQCLNKGLNESSIMPWKDSVEIMELLDIIMAQAHSKSK